MSDQQYKPEHDKDQTLNPETQPVPIQKPIPYSQWNVQEDEQDHSSSETNVQSESPSAQTTMNPADLNDSSKAPIPPHQNSNEQQNQVSNPMQQDWNAKQFNRGGRIELMLTEQQEIDFKKARTLSSASMICAVVSLFFGGILLSAVGLGCAYASYRRSKKHLQAQGNVGMFAHAMKRTAVTSAMFCAFSLALNAFAVWQMMPMITEMLNSGSLGLSGGEAAVVQNSTWG